MMTVLPKKGRKQVNEFNETQSQSSLIKKKLANKQGFCCQCAKAV